MNGPETGMSGESRWNGDGEPYLMGEIEQNRSSIFMFVQIAISGESFKE